ncbi:MAG: hypothetical protein GY804_08520 [Alphaproteobacteria bacterium]|nr:hypothetical protein [Alphaproteobacteria bacterium]
MDDLLDHEFSEGEKELEKDIPYFMNKVDDSLNLTDDHRDNVIGMLNTVIKNNPIKPDAKPRDKEVALNIVNTMLTALNDKDKAHVNRAKLALKDNSISILEDVASDINLVSSKIKNITQYIENGIDLDDDEKKEKLQAAFKATEDVITDGEMYTDPEEGINS